MLHWPVVQCGATAFDISHLECPGGKTKNRDQRSIVEAKDILQVMSKLDEAKLVWGKQTHLPKQNGPGKHHVEVKQKPRVVAVPARRSKSLYEWPVCRYSQRGDPKGLWRGLANHRNLPLQSWQKQVVRCVAHNSNHPPGNGALGANDKPGWPHGESILHCVAFAGDRCRSQALHRPHLQ